MNESIEDILNEWAQDLYDAITEKPWGIVIEPLGLRVSNEEEAMGISWPLWSAGKLEDSRPEWHNIYDYDQYLMEEHGYDAGDANPMVIPSSEFLDRACNEAAESRYGATNKGER